MWNKYTFVFLSSTVFKLVNYFIFCFTKVRRNIKSFTNVRPFLTMKTKNAFLFVDFEMEIKSLFCFHSFNFCFWKQQNNKTTMLCNSQHNAIHSLNVLFPIPSHHLTWCWCWCWCDSCYWACLIWYMGVMIFLKHTQKKNIHGFAYKPHTGYLWWK